MSDSNPIENVPMGTGEPPKQRFQTIETKDGYPVSSVPLSPPDESHDETPVESQDAHEDSQESREEAPAQEQPSEEAVPQGVQKRFDQLTYQRREAERKAAALEAKIAELEARITSPNTPEPTAQNTSPAAEAAPDPRKYRYGEVDPDYVRDVVSYNVRATMAEEQSRQEQQRAQQAKEAAAREHVTSVQSFWVEAVNKARASSSDVDEIISAAQNDEFAFSPVMAEALVGSDHAVDVARHLKNNPLESQRIAQLSPLAQAAQIGRLEATFASKKRTTNAPPPPRTQIRGQDGRFSVRGDTNDFAAFEAAVMGRSDKR